jgi:hypothetical protein
MLRTAQLNDAVAQLLISNSDPVPKEVWRKKKAYGPAGTAGLTSAEIARGDLLAREKAARGRNPSSQSRA